MSALRLRNDPCVSCYPHSLSSSARVHSAVPGRLSVGHSKDNLACGDLRSARASVSGRLLRNCTTGVQQVFLAGVR